MASPWTTSGMPSTSCMEADLGGYGVSITSRSQLTVAGRRGLLALVPILVLPLGSCDVTPEYLRRGLQEQRLEEVGLPEVDPSGTSSSAGLSVLRDFDIKPLSRRRIGSDTTSQGFHRYVHRCGTCHAAPDPALRTASEWKYVFRRMEKHLKEKFTIQVRIQLSSGTVT